MKMNIVDNDDRGKKRVTTTTKQHTRSVFFYSNEYTSKIKQEK
jgi:hypothetical protein